MLQDSQPSTKTIKDRYINVQRQVTKQPIFFDAICRTRLSSLRRSQNFTGISIEEAFLKLLNDDVGINLTRATLAIEGLTEVLAILGMVEHYG